MLLALLYLAGACWFVLGTRRRFCPDERTPRVSVIVAARDEVEHIGNCLHSLLAQNYPPDKYEIIVVDDGSIDGTDQIVRGFGSESVAIRLLETDGKGAKKVALSLGIADAQGEVILTTDADCVVPPGWVRGMVAHFTEGVGMVIGFSQIGLPAEIANLRQGYEAVDFLNLMACIWGSTGHGHPMAASGQNLGFLRQVFIEVGGYEKVMHRASGDDVLLMQMVRRLRNWSIVFASQKETFIRHPLASSWIALLNQRTRWASNAPVLAGLDPLFFGYMLVTYSLSWLVLAAPVLCWGGFLDPQWTLAALGVKLSAEWAVFRRGVALSERHELRRYFAFWALVQPLHVVLVGSLGCLGIFRWKGGAHLWGRRKPTRRIDVEFSESTR